MRQALSADRIFTGELMLDQSAVIFDGGQILDVVPSSQVPSDLPLQTLPPGSILAPGFIDTQVNGGGGVLFNAAPTVESCHQIAAAHRRFGTAALLPTFITDSRESMEAAADAAAIAARDPAGGIIGLHLEGPFLAPERRGVHAADQVRAPTAADLDWLCSLPDRFPDGRVLVSLAPERVTDSQIRRLAESGLILAGAHSAASYERTAAAVKAGLRGFTHLFNAMPPLMNREPGIAGAALATPDTFCGLIVDGIHVHPAMLGLALACKPRGTLFLVTDAMPPTGTDLESFELYGARIFRRDGRLVTADGVLAGADLDMASAVRRAAELPGVGLEEALRMASLYPARFLRLDHRRGRLASGFQADMVQLDESVQVKQVWQAATARL